MGTFAESEAVINHGKHIAYGDDVTTPTYITVAGTTDVDLPDRELGQSDVTNDDTADFHKDSIPGMFAPGKASFKYRYGKTQFAAIEAVYQLATVAATRGGGAGGAIKKWKVTIPDGSTATFRGYLTKHSLPMEGDDDSPVCECEIAVKGKITYTAAA